MYQLYSNRYSGHSYKVAMLLALSGSAYRLIEVDLSVPREERSADFRAASRFLEVPVLIDGDARLCQSNNILSYLARKLSAYGGDNADDAIRVNEWLCWESNRIGFSIANLRFYKRFAKSVAPDLERFFADRAVSDLAVLDGALCTRDFLVGTGMTIADLSCSGYLYWLHEAGLDVAQWPHVQQWLDRIACLPGWQPPDALLAGR